MGGTAACKGGPLGVSLECFDVVSLRLGVNYVNAVPGGTTKERAALRRNAGASFQRLDV